MKRNIKKFALRSISVVLSVLLVFCMIPTVVFADLFDISEKEVSHTEAPDIYEVIDRRSENTKHFRMEDGSYIAVQYETPVHYKDKNGTWQDIDNTLVSSLNEYKTKTSRVKFEKKIAGNEDVFSIHDGNCKMTVSLNGAIKKTAGRIESFPSDFDDTVSQLQKMTTLDKLSSKIIYENILDGIDLEYIVVSQTIKENIIVKKSREEYRYTFQIELNNLDATMREDGSVIVFDPQNEKVVYEIPRGYMYDANGQYSDAVTYSLQKSGKRSYAFTVTADSSWINSQDRAFPVVVDPTVTYLGNGDVVRTSTVSSGSPNSSQVNSYVRAGYSTTSSMQNMRIYAKSMSLVTIPSSAIITSATLSLHQTGYTYTGSMSSGVELGVYAVKGKWYGSSYLSGSIYFDEICWSTQPTFDSTLIDMRLVNSSTNNSNIVWDITKIAKKWASGELENNGVVIKLRNENLSSYSGYATFDSSYSGLSDSRKPMITISYCEIKGIEPYYSYYEVSNDAAGTAYINSFNGNLSLVHSSLTTTDEILPYTFGLVYNSYMANQNYGEKTEDHVAFSKSSTGKGFKLFTDETVIETTINGSTVYIWNDSDGTDHYFSYDKAFGKYVDDDGLQLTIVKDQKGFQIKDDVGNTKVFDSAGLLSSIKDVNGNSHEFYRESGLLKKISLNAGSNVFEQLVFTYKNGTLVTVQDKQTGFRAELYYSDTYNGNSCSQSQSGYLRKIEYIYSNASSIVVTFDYDANGRINFIKDLKTKFATYFEYDSDGRVEKVHQFSNATETSTYTSLLQASTVNGVSSHPISGITYQSMQTTLRVAGADDVYGTSDDAYMIDKFDRSGRIASSYSMVNGVICAEQSVEYEDTSAKTKNKIRKTSVSKGISGNRLSYPAFNRNSSWGIDGWTTIGTGYSSSYQSYKHSDGDYYSLSISSTNSSPVYNSSVRCTERLSVGTYTFSASLDTSSVYEGTEAYLRIEKSNGVLIDEKMFGRSRYGLSLWNRYNITFSLNEADDIVLIIGVRYQRPNVTTSASLSLDSAMLEIGKGNNVYNMIPDSDFEGTLAGTLVNANKGTTNSMSGTSSLYMSGLQSNQSYTLSIPRPYEESYYDEEIQIEKKTFVLSAWGKGDSVSTGYPGYYGYSNFMVQVTLNYYNTSFKSVYQFPFNDKISDWQYITGIVESEPDANGIRHQITSIDIQILHQNNPFPAWVDDIALVEDCDAVTCYEYDSQGYCISETNSEGKKTEYTYSGGDLTSQVDENNNLQYEYSDHLLTSVSNIKKIGGADRGSRVSYEYDSYGNVTKETMENHDLSKISSIAQNSYLYRSNTLAQQACFGKLDTSTDLVGTETKYYYDSKGRVTGISQDVKYGNYSPVGTIYSYNDFGQLIGAVPATVNSDGTLIQLSSEKNVEYIYNEKGDLKYINTNSIKYSFLHNAFGKIRGIGYEKDESTSLWISYEYQNNYGKLTKETYANNFSVYYQYDDFGNLKGIGYNGAQYVKFSFAYDNSGKLIEKKDLTNNATYWYTYDASGRIIQENMVSGGKTLLKVDNSFDEQGRLKSTYRYYGDAVTAPLSYTEYTYDEFGYVKSVIMGGSGKECQYEYDDFGRITNKTVKGSYGSDKPIQQDYYYDDNYIGKIAGVFDYLGSGVSRDHFYFYDDAGQNTPSGVPAYSNNNIKRIISQQGGREYLRCMYSYDAQGRIAIESTKNNNVDSSQLWFATYEYDSTGNRTSKTVYATEYDYLSFSDLWYDAEGNLYYHRVYQENGDRKEEDILLTPYDTYTYSYGNGDQLKRYNDVSLNYDVIGNMTSYGNVKLEWEGKQLVKYKDDQGNITTYTYDENGLRISKTRGNVVQKYSYDGDKVMRILTSSGNVIKTDLRMYYDAQGRPVSMRIFNMNSAGTAVANDYTYFFVTNIFGDVTSIVDGSGNILVDYYYDPFGKIQTVDKAGSTASALAIENNPFKYRGYFYDSESGYYYLNSRYYNPEWGRFISMDDVQYLTADGSMTNCNLYVYCNNNPIMYVDPDGHAPEWWQWAMGVIGAACVVTAAGLAIFGTGGVAAFGVGALIGSVGLGAVGGGIGAAVAYSQGSDVLGGVLTGFGIGAPIGFVVGGTIGYMTHPQAGVAMDPQYYSGLEQPNIDPRTLSYGRARLEPKKVVDNFIETMRRGEIKKPLIVSRSGVVQQGNHRLFMARLFKISVKVVFGGMGS